MSEPVYIPPSAEVIGEELHEELVKVGIPRDEQGGAVRTIVQAVAEEVAEYLQFLSGAV